MVSFYFSFSLISFNYCHLFVAQFISYSESSGPQQKFSSHPIAYHSYHLAPVNTLQARYKAQPKQLAGNNGLFDNSNDFVDSSNCLTFECRQRNVANVVVPDGGFFGFNTSVFASRGLAGGVYANLAGIYDNIVQAYVEDVYTDVIEGYTIATIKVKIKFKKK